jgi:large subunit ribosomal protein L18e
MGIDLGLRSKLKSKNTRHIKTPNLYLRLAHKLYSFLSRRTDSKFNAVVAKRLAMSRVNRPPLSLKHVGKYMKGKEGKTAVVVGSILDDERQLTVPGVTLAALRISDSAKERLEKAGGRFITLD